MSVVLILSATVSFALPACKGSYNYKTWTDCIGTITYSTGRKSVGEYKNGNRVRFSTGSTEPVKLSSLKAAYINLSQEQRKQVQSALVDKGFYKFSIDGLYGNGTAAALTAYNQQNMGGADLTKAVNAKKVLNLLLSNISTEQSTTEQQLQKALLQLRNRESDLAQLQADLQVAQTNLQTQGAELQNTQSELEEAQPLREALAQAIFERQVVDKKLTEAEIKATLLATAQAELREAEAISSEAQRQMAVLSEEVRELMAQIGGLQSILDDYRRRDEENNVKITNLGSDLNMALAQAASEARRNLALEAVEKKRLAEEAARLAIEAKSLEQYKSDFFGRMRGLLEGIESVRIVGDRFVFSSEVLFPSGGADLSVAGRRQISKVSTLLKNIAEQMPAGIDWILQVDGHTDDQPLLSGSNFGSNWELSQARALSVVVFLVNEQGMEPRRLSANGFGEFQPLNPENTGAARAQNRRIELKLTKK